jgi:hypothetical protein
LRHHGRSDVPPMLAIKHFSFEADLGALLDTPKTVNRVTLDGLEIQIPPKGERPHFGSQQLPEETAAARAASGGVGDRGGPGAERSLDYSSQRQSESSTALRHSRRPNGVRRKGRGNEV